METPPEFSFPIFLAYSTEYANQLYITITLQKRLNWYPWVSTGWNMERCDVFNYNSHIEVI